MTPEFEVSETQEKALIYLNDNITEELVFGGAKNGGKTFLGCFWTLGNCLMYPGVFYFIARQELNDLRKYTIPSIHEWFSVVKNPNTGNSLNINDYCNFNGQDNIFNFHNGSKLYLINCKYLRSDPLYERFGSMQMTSGMIEEAGEVSSLARDNLRISTGRIKNDLYKIKPKMLYTCNPKKAHWLYNDFYKPNKENKLPPEKKFIQSLVTQNIFRQSNAIDVLDSIKDPIARARLRYGEWEYEDDPATLCDYDAITDLFTNDHVIPTGKKYISADLAMKGRDKFIVGVWDGLVCNIAIDKDKCSGKEIEQDIKMLMNKNSVPHSRTIVDSDGLGAYLESYLTGIKEFHGGAAGTQRYIDGKKTSEYNNLKSECGFKLAELINERKIKIICTEQQKEQIINEIGVLKIDKVDNDTSKKAIISKDKMKEMLQGKSPDYLDQLLMRMYFEIKKEVGIA